MFRSSLALAGRTSLFASFPSTSYWATFTKSLRDESSAHAPKLMLTLTGSRRPPIARSPGRHPGVDADLLAWHHQKPGLHGLLWHLIRDSLYSGY
jgi:hypothetical protein